MILTKKLTRFTWFLIIVLTLLLTKVYFNNSFPFTHDGENHLARFANYKVALKEGQFPPRFAPNLFNHYGYPVFNYNYPLANILSVPFSIFDVSYELTFKIISTSFVLVGLVGIKKWLEKLNFSFLGQWIGLFSFATLPYLISTIAFRGNIGEIAAISLLPWIFWLVESIFEQKISSYQQKIFLMIILTAFLLSHNVTVLFAFPVFLIYALIRFGLEKKPWLSLLEIIISSLGLSFWFWLPAIFEKNQVVLDSNSLSNGFSNHFPSLQQLVSSPLKFGFSYLGKIDSLGMSLGLSQLVAFLISLVLLVKLNLKKKAKLSFLEFMKAKFYKKIFSNLIPYKSTNKSQLRLISLLSFLAFLMLFFQLDLTRPIWEAIPLARFIQFPWRLGMIWGVIVIPVIVWFFERSSFWFRSLIIVLLLIQVVAISRVKAVDYFHKTNVDYDAFAQSTSTLNENLPKTFTYKNIADWQPGPSILEGSGEITVNYWKGSDRSYELSLTEESVVVEPTMNYLGWRTLINNGESKKISPDYLETEEIAGRIAYKLEAGNYQVRTQFTQWTWARILGNGLSLVTAALIAFKLGFSVIKSEQK